MARRIALFLVLAASVLAVGCSSASEEIGPKGGMVHLDGATLAVPPGALSETTTVTLEWQDPDDGASPQVRVFPQDLRFALPARLSLQVPELKDEEVPAFETRGLGEDQYADRPDATVCESGRLCADIDGAILARVRAVSTADGGGSELTDAQKAILIALILGM